MTQPEHYPLISVIIPHYNDLDGLQRSLAALNAQDYPADKFEIIVADNGSKIGMEAVQREIGDAARVINAPVQGPGPARNAGVSEASHDILAFVDSDCLAVAGWLTEIVTRLTAQGAPDILGGDVTIWTASENMTSIEAYEAVFGYRARMYVERDHFAPTGNMALRREIFDSVGPFAGIEVAEDLEWGNRAYAMGYTIGFSEKMQVATPARQSFSELERKWDRHLGHEFAKTKTQKLGRVKWIAKALMLAVSPTFEWPKIVASKRVQGAGNFWKALLCLARIRLYRCRKMLAIALSGDGESMAKRWRAGS